MDNEHSGSTNSGSGAVTSAPADIAEEKTGFGAQAGAALSKVGEAAQQAGSHVKEAATSLARSISLSPTPSTIGEPRRAATSSC